MKPRERQYCEKCGQQVYTGKCCSYCGYKEFTVQKKKEKNPKKTDPEKQMDLFNGE